MYKAEGMKPHVYFPDQEVWLNLNGAGADGEYRLVEVMEDSDPEWGMLVGYGFYSQMTSYTKNNILAQAAAVKNTADPAAQSPASGQAGKQTRGGNNPSQVGYGKNIDYNLAVGEKGGSTAFRPKLNTFYNSNVPKAVEIAKEMDVPCDRPFTMVLEQVLLLKEDAQRTYASALNSVTPDQVLMSEGRAGIPYTVYAIDDTAEPRTVLREAGTGPGGALTLYAGEYASFDLPEGTLWTLTEDQPATFEKPALRTEGPAANRISQVGEENLLFVYQTAAAEPAPEPELKVNVTNRDVYLDNIRSKYMNQERYRYNLDLSNHVQVLLDGKPLSLSKDSIKGTYSSRTGLEKLVPIREEVLMDYTVTYTVQESGTVLTADFTLTYHPPMPITITRNIVENVNGKGVYDEAGKQITWEPDSGTLKIPEFVRESANGPLCRVTQLGTGSEEDGEGTEIVIGAKRIYRGVFSQKDELQYVEVPEGVTKISLYAFRECTELKSIKLPKEMESIGSWAFQGCSNLESVDIPKGIKRINNTFRDCIELREVKIPNTMESISRFSFQGCENVNIRCLTEDISTIAGVSWAPWGATNSKIWYSDGNGGWIIYQQ